MAQSRASRNNQNTRKAYLIKLIHILEKSDTSYPEQNHRNLAVSSRLVRKIDRAELSDINVKHLFVDNLPGMKIAFYVLLEAEFVISETDRHNDRYDEKTQWYKISCAGDLSCNLDDFSITATEEYNSKDKQQSPMSDSLVPIIHKDQLESVAKDFLERYYQEALHKPMAIDPNILAERMGLSIQLKHITSDFSAFGQVFLRIARLNIMTKGYPSIKTSTLKAAPSSLIRMYIFCAIWDLLIIPSFMNASIGTSTGKPLNWNDCITRMRLRSNAMLLEGLKITKPGLQPIGWSGMQTH